MENKMIVSRYYELTESGQEGQLRRLVFVEQFESDTDAVKQSIARATTPPNHSLDIRGAFNKF